MLAPYLLALALLGGHHHRNGNGDFSKIDCDKMCTRPGASCDKNCTRKPPKARADCFRVCKDAVTMCEDKCKEAQQKMKTLPKKGGGGSPSSEE